MSEYRSIATIKLKDGRIISPASGIIEIPDAEAAELLKNRWIAPAKAPLVSGIAEETIQKQAEIIIDLEKKLAEKNSQILNLQNIITAKEADIDRLNKSQVATQPTPTQPAKK